MFREKTVAVVGAGDPALEAALLLCRYRNKAIVIRWASKFVANEGPIDECLKNNVDTIPNSIVTEIKGDAKVEELRSRV